MKKILATLLFIPLLSCVSTIGTSAVKNSNDPNLQTIKAKMISVSQKMLNADIKIMEDFADPVGFVTTDRKVSVVPKFVMFLQMLGMFSSKAYVEQVKGKKVEDVFDLKNQKVSKLRNIKNIDSKYRSIGFSSEENDYISYLPPNEKNKHLFSGGLIFVFRFDVSKKRWLVVLAD